MWLLSNSAGKSYYLLREKNEYIVGRTSTDITLRNDSSVSRKHAILRFQDEPYKLLLTDSNSKYGTYIKGNDSHRKVNPGEVVHLSDGDCIRFGVLHNEWKVNRMTFVSMCSSVSGNNLKLLEKKLSSLGGRIISGWEAECTHLTMMHISVTVKVLYALLNNIPIVSCEYWSDLIKAIRNGKPTLPNANLYLPKNNDAILMKNEFDFGFRPERKTLFSSKIFVFQHKLHFEMYSPIIQMAGGMSKNLNSGFPKSSLIKDNVIVVQYIPPTQSQLSQTLNTISDFLESHSRRVVAEYEIGLAILNCSVEKYCNPNYKIVSELIKTPAPIQTQEFGTVLVANTNESINSGCGVEVASPSSTKAGQNKDSEESIITTSSMSENNAANSSDIKNLNEKSLLANEEHFDNTLDVLNGENPPRDKLKRKRVKHLDSIDQCSSLPQSKIPHIEKITDAKFVGIQLSPELVIPEKDSRRKISTTDFRNKTHISTNRDVSTSLQAGNQDSTTHTKKRGRIAMITENDSDDENDLFNFGGSDLSEIAKRTRIDNDCDESDGEQSSSEKELIDAAVVIDRSNNANGLAQIEQYSNSNKKSNSSNPLPKPKPIPKIINTTGWFIRTKTDEDNKAQHGLISENPKLEISSGEDNENKHSLDSNHASTTGFEIRFCFVKKLQNKPLQTNGEAAHNNSDNGSCRNFKVFIKKRNYIRQHVVIQCASR